MTQTADRATADSLRVEPRPARHHVGAWRRGDGDRTVRLLDPSTGLPWRP